MMDFSEYNSSRDARGIAEWLIGKIRGGEVSVGDTLPATRVAGPVLGVDRNTVQAAYAILTAGGYTEARAGSGTTVVAARPEAVLFSWRRFWWPGGSSEAGPSYWRDLLLDPEQDGLIQPNDRARTLTDLHDRPALVLLGEAGFGKSTEIRNRVKSLDTAAPGSAVLIDLAEVESAAAFESRFMQRLALRTRGDQQVEVFLDSLDEGVLRSGTLMAGICHCLQLVPKNSLLLRVGCRTNAWTDAYLNALRSALPGTAIETWRLLELREKDVRHAIEKRGANADQFLALLRSHRLVHLAARPITLRLLLEAGPIEDREPFGLVSTYRRGLRSLATEPDRGRESRRLSAGLDPDSKMDLARAIAAGLILCGRSTVDDGSGVARLTSPVSLTEINRLAARQRDYERQELSQLLNSPLFVPDQPGTFRFAHRSFAEFLAADFLAQSSASDDQIERVLLVRQGGSVRVPPEVRETVAWLASIRPSMFDRVLGHEPEALLLTDAASLTDAHRSELVGRFLERIESGLVPWERVRGVEDGYPRLRHPGLIDQLQPVLTDKSRSAMAREVAIDIAADCGVSELSDTLIQICVDSAESGRMRTQAAYGLRRLAQEGVRIQGLDRVRTQIAGENLQVIDQEFLGCCLHLLWPDHLSASELFALLPPERAPSLYGAYASFLTSERTVRSVPPSDLPIALTWARKQRNNREFTHTRDLVDALLYRAWEQLELPGVLDAVADLVLNRLIAREPPIGAPERTFGWGRDRDERCNEELANHPDRRRMLTAGLIREITQRPTTDTGERDVCWLIYGSSPLARKEDLPWVLQRTLGATHRERSVWVDLANRLVLFHATEGWNSDERDSVAEAMKSPLRPTELFEALEPVQFGSDREKALQRSHREMKALGRPRRRRGPRRDNIRQVVESWLSGSEQGLAWSWWRIHQALIFGKDWEAEASQTVSGGTSVITCDLWKKVDARLRDRILESARRYLEGLCPFVDPEGESLEFGRHWSSIEALRLMWTGDREWLERQSTEWWRGWQGVVVQLESGCEAAEEVDSELVRLAYASDPARFRSLFARRLRGRPEQDRSERLDAFERSCDALMAAEVDAYLGEGELAGPSQFESLLRFLIAVEGWSERVQCRVRQHIAPCDVAAKVGLSVVAASVAAVQGDVAWELFWPRMQTDPSWGKRVVGKLVSPSGRGGASIYQSLTNKRLAALVYWLYAKMPLGPLPDRTKLGAYSPTLDEDLAHWRSAALSQLVSRGSEEGQEALQRLVQEFPNDWWLQEQLLVHSDRALKWTPPTTASLREFLVDPRARSGKSEADLCAATLESLRRFEQRLQHRHNPLRDNLWNRTTLGPKPKPEPHFSDNVADHLRMEFVNAKVVVDREVEILRPRSSPADEQGKVLDILVQSHDGAAGDECIKAYVEVKLDNNPQVLLDLDEQLVNRYLHVERCGSGIYCVGWTGTGSWRSKADLEQSLQARAAAINDRGMVHVSVVVLDCSLHQDNEGVAAKSKPRAPRTPSGRASRRRKK